MRHGGGMEWVVGIVAPQNTPKMQLEFVDLNQR